jgi:hypothetical protein
MTMFDESYWPPFGIAYRTAVALKAVLFGGGVGVGVAVPLGVGVGVGVCAAAGDADADASAHAQTMTRDRKYGRITRRILSGTRNLAGAACSPRAASGGL